jgi:nicotinate phosphoribosyltransferase
LSIEARKMLDAAEFPNSVIVCSGDLDEYAIAELKSRGAKIDIWGVGTKLVTGYPDGALNGVYKLGAVRRPGEPWRYRIKLSDEPVRSSMPGLQQMRRYCEPSGRIIGDVIYEAEHGVKELCIVFDLQSNQRREIPATAGYSDLLAPIFRRGELVYRVPEIHASREGGRKQLSCAPPAVLRLNNPQRYDVGLEASLYHLRSELVARAKQQGQTSA